MSIKSLYPDIRPSLNLNFANSKALDGRITFTRDSIATYVGANGLIQTAQRNAPRFDHDPITGESLGLLIEEQRTNLLKGTSNFASGYWSIGGDRSAQGSNQLAPDGTTSAFSNAYNGTSGDANIYYSDAGNNAGGEAPTSNSTVHTLSIFVKIPSANNYIHGVRIRTYNNNHSATFNLKTGTIIGTNEGTTTNRIEAYPNGWYRCSITFTSGTDGNQGIQFYMTNEFNSSILDDSSANGEALYFWGPQLEAGSFPTSHVPTNAGSTATRIADRARITGTSFSNFFNTTEGTLVVQGRTSAGNSLNYTNQPIISIHAGSTTNRIIVFDRDAGTLEWNVVDGSSANGSGVLLDETTSYSGAADYIICGTYKNGAPTRAVANGLGADGTTIESSGKNDTINIFNQMDIGNELGTRQCSSPIKQIRYYPLSLSDAQIKTLVQ